MVARKRRDLGDYKVHRLGVRMESVTLKGFELYFETWNESLVFEVVASSIAYTQ